MKYWPAGLLILVTACAGLGQPTASPTATTVAVAVISPSRTARPSSTATATGTSSATASASPTPRPTVTPTRTDTPSPSPTALPTFIATKQVLLEISDTPGDGGGGFEYPFGRYLPRLVLYTDGEFLVMSKDLWYLETTLSTHQMCSLLSQIARTGFFGLPDDDGVVPYDALYHFVTTPEPIEGAPGLVILVNGTPAKFVDIYSPDADAAVTPIKSVLQLLENYRPAGLQSYVPNRLLLVAQAGRGFFGEDQSNDGNEPTAIPAVPVWPASLPPLAAWAGDSLPLQLFIQGDQVAPALRLNLPQHYGVFTDGIKLYSVDMRPLLPHETLDPHDNGVPRGVAQFDLPFSCAG